MEKLPTEQPEDIGRGKFERHEEIVELNAGKLKIVDLVPENPKTAVPTVFGAGWISNAETATEVIETLAQRGRRTLSLENIHGIDAEDVDQYPNAELRKVAALIQMLEKKGIEQIDAVGHSEGALYMVIAATLYPEKFRNIMLVNPASMIGPDNPGRLTARFIGDGLKQFIRSLFNKEHKKPLLRINKVGAEGLKLSPTQAIRQVFALSSTQIQEMLKNLREKGVGVSIMHSGGDIAFPLKSVKKHAKGAVDDFYSRPGTHNEIYLDRGEYFSRQVDRALDRLEKNKNK